MENNSGWSSDTNNIYMVLTGSGIHECFSGVLSPDGCTFSTVAAPQAFCGYHSMNGSTIYAFIGDDCGSDVDSLSSHELIESVTDPYGGTWKGTGSNDEIGDKCNLLFSPNNAQQDDVVLNGAGMDVQEQWSNAASSCATDFNAQTTDVPPVVTISNTASFTNYAGGVPIEHYIELTNLSDTDPAASITVADTLPAGETYLGQTGSFFANVSGQTLTWSISSSLAVKDTDKIEFYTTAAQPGIVQDCAQLSYSDWLELHTVNGGQSCDSIDVQSVPTTTQLTASGSIFTLNAPVTLTAKVSSTISNFSLPSIIGTVSFEAAGHLVCPTQSVSGLMVTVICSTFAVPEGTAQFLATFTPSTGSAYGSSTGSLAILVNPQTDAWPQFGYTEAGGRSNPSGGVISTTDVGTMGPH